MPALTTLLEFKVDHLLNNPVHWKTAEQELVNHLKALNLEVVYKDTTRGLHIHMVGQDGSHATVRSHQDVVVTVDLHEYAESENDARFNEEVVEDLEGKLQACLQSKKFMGLPAIKRGADMRCYFPSTDRKIIEYDFDKCLLDTDTRFQNVKIMHSPQFGNMLILDNDPNMAESDILYTHAITGHGHEDYSNRTILILGGGDGGILHELLKENPKHVIMVDIDEVVVKNAPTMLRGICGDSLDQLRGENYEVLIEDCIPILERYGKEGRQFDYVINDLTAIPCTPQPVGALWDFMRKILDLSMKVLSPSGKYYTQGNGSNMVKALAMYEEQLNKLSVPVDFRKQKVFVPSYHEQWVFYEIWKKHEN